MGNTIITADTNSPEYTAALTLHQQIITNGTIAANALYEMCRCLKQMRDDKLYTALGYGNFDDYCEGKANIKARQAYSYIKTYESLGKEFLQSNANLGITKLELLTHVNPVDRADFVQEVNLQELSVSELKEEIERLKAENGEKGEQLSFFTEKASAADEQAEQIAELKEKLKAAENALEERREPDPEAIAEEVNKAIGEQKKLHLKAVDGLTETIAELTERLEKAESAEPDQSIIDEQVSKAVAERDEEYKDKLKQLEEKLAGSQAESDSKVKELEEKLKNAAPADEVYIEFKFYFTAMQENLGKFLGVLDKMEDGEKKAKFKGAAVKYLNMILEKLD